MDREALLARRRQYEDDVARMRQDVADYRSGRFAMRSNQGIGFVDISEQIAARLERSIQILEDIIIMIDEKLTEY
ncbi:hypothetical protein [Neorhizobium petrolearium]|uniref:hypothetical protein n=1 Tax=Neorhizobium petrolearium TaxID=515361 RepID=UPI003F17A870